MAKTVKNEITSDAEESVNATRIAELAYSKAESSGFEPGHEFEDRLEAERELFL